MKIKYLVICVQDGCDIQSVTPFDNYSDADSFIAKDAIRLYEEVSSDSFASEVDVYHGGAELVDDDTTYIWSIYPLVLEKEDGAMLVKKFKYNGYFCTMSCEYADYTVTFKEWTKDPGVAICTCSDGEERRIPTCAIEGFDHKAYPKQDEERG